MRTEGPDVLILGANARAAAHSALRANLRPCAIDLFADRDLAACGPALQVPRGGYPQALEELARDCPACPWIYTGAIENHPALVERISKKRPLWGVGVDALVGVRDPFALSAALRAAGLPALEVRLTSRGLPRDGSWLVKPIASAGGHGVWQLTRGVKRTGGSCYFQERKSGTPLAALFVGSRSGTKLLGVTWQWLGRPGAPFGYRGSVGPWPLEVRERAQVAAMGRAFGSAFGLLGLFGVDFVLHDGAPWPVEVNPRYTASVEVLELALQRAFLDEHRFACDHAAPLPSRREARPAGVVGKAILFAEEAVVFANDVAWQPPADWFEIPIVADIPHPGTQFEPGEPVCTVFARAGTIPACRARLRRALARWRKRLEVVMLK
ncbi:MAG TPA: ATP-grasp domain-containing protein [Isosphaeraceae bacterium]|nr:ATP-grasp domain-containing protein [Isosphaeraceae bacterium]